ncbi:MAG: DHHW family protein, partial [Oscillospiraceae bacterium]|nr:DHHW family protein [Oscillospiraceae bacterium]
TSYSKCKKVGTLPDTISYFPFDATISYDGKTYPGIYDFTKLTTRDKYAMFLYGNHAESLVESEESRDKKGSLLIIKDSYADSMIPFLTRNYSSITCIDPRYYLGSIQELAKGDYDDILILLGFENLSGEGNWVKLSF